MSAADKLRDFANKVLLTYPERAILLEISDQVKQQEKDLGDEELRFRRCCLSCKHFSEDGGECRRFPIATKTDPDYACGEYERDEFRFPVIPSGGNY